jgi:hypothetical protein
MSVAEDRGEGNEVPEQQSVELSEWIEGLEAHPERIKLRELKALLEKLDPDDEWVRQFKGRIDEVLEPEVLGSDAVTRLAKLKRHLVFELFTQRGPFWEAIRDVRARLGVETRTELPPPNLAYAVLVAEEEWPEGASESRERLVGEVFHLMDLAIPKEYRDVKVFDVPWIGFLLGCVLFDPPETELLVFARYSDPKPMAFRSEQKERPERQRYMPAPPVRFLRDPDEVNWAMFELWALTMVEVQEKHLEPLGLNLWTMIEDVWETTDLLQRHQDKIKANPALPYIPGVGTTGEDARRAVGLLRGGFGGRSKEGAPTRDPLIALQAAILYVRHNAPDPDDRRSRRWTHERLAKEFGLKSARVAQAYVEEGKKTLEKKCKQR